MASIDRVQTSGGVRYRARYRAPEGGSRSKTFRRKIDAERFLTSIEHSKNVGAYVEPSAGRMTVREYGEAWRAGKVRQRPGSAARLDSALRNWIYPTFGDRSLMSVQQSEVQEWVTYLAARLAPSTVEVTYSFLASMYRKAVRQRQVIFTPCIDVELPEVVKRAVVPLKEEEVTALLAAIVDRYKAMLLVLAGSGLREGELWGLTVDRVDFFRRTVSVDRQLLQLKPAVVKPWHEHIHSDLYLGPPKTPASVRTVPVEPVVIDVLARHLAKYGPGPQRLVFTTREGLPIRRNRFHEGPWASAKKAAKVRRDKLVLHDLRHFYASLLIYQGVNVKQVQKRMGHRSATETLDTYAAIFDAADDLTREEAVGMLARLAAALDTPLTVPLRASEAE